MAVLTSRMDAVQDFPEGEPRQIKISGKPDAVERAVKMVQELIQGEPGSAQAIIQKVRPRRNLTWMEPLPGDATDECVRQVMCDGRTVVWFARAEIASRLCCRVRSAALPDI